MAFSGNIQDLSLIDVLQLISQSSKTGVMHVMSEELDAQVFLKEGRLIDVKSEDSKIGHKLGTYLLNKDLITEEQLHVLLEKQTKMPVRFGTLLVDEGYLTSKNLKKIMADIVKEKFLKVLSIEKGTYDFEPTIVEYNPDDVMPIDLNSILLDILKDLDEIKLFRSKIQSMEVIYSKTTNNDDVVIEDTVTNDEPVVIATSLIKLNKQSYFVYANIDGKNTISDIVDKTVLSEHFVLKVIFLLYNAKKIEIPAINKNTFIEKKSSIDPQKLTNIAAGIGILVMIALSSLSIMKYLELYQTNYFMKTYYNAHQLKLNYFENNLTKIYELEHGNENVDLDTLKLGHQQFYL